jgi:hypothetical protein
MLQKKDFFLLLSLGTCKANFYSIDYQHDLFMPTKEPLVLRIAPFLLKFQDFDIFV